MPTEQTGFGLVDRETLERLQDKYDNMMCKAGLPI